MGYKTRSNYGTGLKECLNPEKCVCLFCKRKRAEAKEKKNKGGKNAT